jgi:phage tail sheath protein FI
MASYKRPDVYVNEKLSVQQTVRSGGTTDAVFLGSHHRGPTTAPGYVESWTDFERLYGGFPSTGTPGELPYAVYNYFSNGGRAAYICRVIGTGAVTATVTLSDRAGSPLATLKVDALNPGTWGNDLRIGIVDRDAVNGRFDLLVYYGGTTDAFLVERWTDLSMVNADGRHVEKIINSPTAGSAYIKVTDMASASAAPTDTPAVAAGTALTGGVAGAVPTTAEKTSAVSTGGLLDQIPGLATVNFPGETTAGVIGAMLTYCENSGRFFAVLDTPVGNDVATANTFVDSITATSYAAVYYPWLTVADPASSAPGATRVCPPGPFMIGKMAETDTLRGVWKAPAGLQTRLAGVLATERTFTNANLDTLNENHLNAIRTVPGAGVVPMGARTLKTNTADKYVNVRRTLNFIKYSAVKSTEFAIFENNDEQLWALISSTLERFLAGIHQQGGLRGASPEQAFYVKCDAELNTPQVIAAGEVRVEIGVALQQPAEFIVITIGQWEGGQSASEAA